jgi:beta-lactamase regulating signal transducer with metallopeptidase domain
MDAAGTLWSLAWELWLAAGWNAAVLAALVFSVLACFGYWIAPRYRHMLWLVVAVRLVLPVAPSSPFSLQHLWSSGSEPPHVHALDVSIGMWEVKDQPLAADRPRLPAHGASDSIMNPAIWIDCIDGAYVLAALVWPLGMIVMTTTMVRAGVRFRRRLSRLPRCHDPRLVQLLDECRRRIGQSRSVSLLVVPGLNSPAQLGLWRPRVLLPEDVAATFNDDALRHVLLHELAHLKRRDVAVSWLLAALRVVHWCNPVFWFVFSRLAAERELACDAEVLRRLEGSSTRGYGETLLRIAGRSCAGDRPATVPGFVLFLGHKSSLRRRLQMMPHVFHGEGRGKCVAALLLVGLLVVAGWTDAGGPQSKAHARETVFELPVGATWTVGNPETPAGLPPETRVYALDDLVARELRKPNATRADVHAMLVNCLSHAVGAEAVNRSAFVNGATTARTQDAAEFTWAQTEGELTNRLLVRATREAHELIGALVGTWRAYGLCQTVLEVRCITTAKSALLAVGSGGKIVSAAAGTAPANDPFRIAFEMSSERIPLSGEVDVRLTRRVPLFLQTLDSGLMRELIRPAQADERTNILFAPKITVCNGQRAVVVSQVHRPFVTGLETGPDVATKPQLELIAEGETLELCAVSDPASHTVRLSCRILCSRITDVQTAGIADGANGESLTVQVPTVEQQRFSASAEVKSGETLLMSPLCRDEQGQQFYVLVTPRIQPE